MKEYIYLEREIPKHIVKQIRADAIEEFAEKCEKWIEKVNDIRCDNSAMLTIANIRALAEELKENKND